MSAESSLNLASTFMRLRADASVEPLPVDESFFARLVAGELGSFHNEYLVSIYRFDTDWSMWEMHPQGDEVVCLLSGCVSFVMEQPDGVQTVELSEPGAFVIVPAATWHTAKVLEASQVLFITAGEGTQHRDVAR